MLYRTWLPNRIVHFSKIYLILFGIKTINFFRYMHPTTNERASKLYTENIFKGCHMELTHGELLKSVVATLSRYVKLVSDQYNTDFWHKKISQDYRLVILKKRCGVVFTVALYNLTNLRISKNCYFNIISLSLSSEVRFTKISLIWF